MCYIALSLAETFVNKSDPYIIDNSYNYTLSIQEDDNEIINIKKEQNKTKLSSLEVIDMIII